MFIARGPRSRRCAGRPACREHRRRFPRAGAEATDAPSSVGAVDAVLLGVKTGRSEAAVAMQPLRRPEHAGGAALERRRVPRSARGGAGVRTGAGRPLPIFVYQVAPGVYKHAGIDPAVVFVSGTAGRASGCRVWRPPSKAASRRRRWSRPTCRRRCGRSSCSSIRSARPAHCPARRWVSYAASRKPGPCSKA
jgi:hypothetical protein